MLAEPFYSSWPGLKSNKTGFCSEHEVNSPTLTDFKLIPRRWSFAHWRNTSDQIHNGSAYTSSGYHTSNAHFGRVGERVEEAEKIPYSKNPSLDFFPYYRLMRSIS